MARDSNATAVPIFWAMLRALPFHGHSSPTGTMIILPSQPAHQRADFFSAFGVFIPILTSSSIATVLFDSHPTSPVTNPAQNHATPKMRRQQV